MLDESRILALVIGSVRSWIGFALIASGLASLIFNEAAVQIRRMWAWRRDDSDPDRDAELNAFYRRTVLAGSVVSIELGLWLTAINSVPLAARVLLYAACGGWTVWKWRRRSAG